MKLNEILKESAGEFLTDINEIKAWLDAANISNYMINDDGSVVVDGDVNIRHKKLTSIPIQFTKVTGYFDCSGNKLTSLAGSPASVGDMFDCSHNELPLLTHTPTEIGEDFYCNNNNLVSLEFLPSNIGRNFYCYNNKLASHTIGILLTGCTYLHGDGDWPKIIEKYLGRPEDIFECQAELIENNFEEFALL